MHVKQLALLLGGTGTALLLTAVKMTPSNFPSLASSIILAFFSGMIILVAIDYMVSEILESIAKKTDENSAKEGESRQ